jgi:hypothetical protein
MRARTVDGTHLFCLFVVFGKHGLEQGGADIFESLDSAIDRTLIFEGERAFDISQFVRYFSGLDLDVFEVLIGLRGSVASLLGIGRYVFDRGAGLLGVTFLIELVSSAQLLLCDSQTEFSTVFGARAFEARFHFFDRFILHKPVGGGECEKKRD